MMPSGCFPFTEKASGWNANKNILHNPDFVLQFVVLLHSLFTAKYGEVGEWLKPAVC